MSGEVDIVQRVALAFAATMPLSVATKRSSIERHGTMHCHEEQEGWKKTLVLVVVHNVG
jgi:hypothetical protein